MNEKQNRLRVRDWIYLAVGLLIQVVVYALTDSSLISFISALAGVCCVILCSQRRISQYYFALAQILSYMILAWQQRLYGELIENVFYLVTIFIGLINWNRHYDDNIVESRHLTAKGWIVTIVSCLSAMALFAWILAMTNDTQPILDSVSTVPAFVAQLLMINRYREQYVFWLILDVFTCVIWLRVGEWVLVSQYLFLITNCIYGWCKWSRDVPSNPSGKLSVIS